VPVFVVLAPFSFSGRVLDTTEATALLSTASIALANCGVCLSSHLFFASLANGACARWEMHAMGSTLQ